MVPWLGIPALGGASHPLPSFPALSFSPDVSAMTCHAAKCSKMQPIAATVEVPGHLVEEFNPLLGLFQVFVRLAFHVILLAASFLVKKKQPVTCKRYFRACCKLDRVPPSAASWFPPALFGRSPCSLGWQRSTSEWPPGVLPSFFQIALVKNIWRKKKAPSVGGRRLFLPPKKNAMPSVRF